MQTKFNGYTISQPELFAMKNFFFDNVCNRQGQILDKESLQVIIDTNF
ncbi:MAG: hypothetical protein IKI08_07300 [Selenomonadaceae bacterium]|nr:hypothetical protein [Selenomonadaceae bacterium]